MRSASPPAPACGHLLHMMYGEVKVHMHSTLYTYKSFTILKYIGKGKLPGRGMKRNRLRPDHISLPD